MTNVYGSPKKVKLRKHLFQVAVEALQRDGWKVERIPRAGKASLRRITRGRESKTVSIRTSQDTHIAFPRTAADDGWATLDEVDAVVAVSVDARERPREALVHLIPGDEMRQRFDRAYKARQEAGHTLPVGRGIWVPLYLPDADTPPSQVGGGAGIQHPPIARVPLAAEEAVVARQAGVPNDADDGDAGEGASRAPGAGTAGFGSKTRPDGEDRPLTIPEAKRLLARALGISPENIKITVEA